MSKRMQVLVDDTELLQMQEIASAQGLTLAEWVRQTLRVAARRQPTGDVDRKIAAVRAAAKHQFPTAEIDQILAEIQSGYLTGMPD